MYRSRTGYCIGLVVLATLLVLLFSSVTIFAGPLNPGPVTVILECIDGEENDDFSCLEGADNERYPLPFVQVYESGQTLGIQEVTTSESNGIPLRGVSLAGGEFRDTSDKLASNGVFLPFDNDAQLFIYKGMNTFRIPITWEYFADRNGTINAKPNYLERLNGVIEGLTQRNATLILDLHNYMRYNPQDVSLNYKHTDPLGSDVIGQGSAAPTSEAFAQLWSNIVSLYHGPNILYGLMNEPHDMRFDLLVKNTNLAIQAIRAQESSLSITVPHFILVSGNNYSGLHSWFGDFASPVTNNFSNGNNALFLDRLVDSRDRLAIEVHQYFDVDSSGTFDECLNFTVFKARFDIYWPRFKAWATENRVRVFLGEFGAPDTPTCRLSATYLLQGLETFPLNASARAGVLGWTAWAAGNSWGDYILSLAPGGKANLEMWDNNLYERFLTPVAIGIPPLSAQVKAIRIRNQSPRLVRFQGGYLPFQFKGNADLQPLVGEGFLYSNNRFTTPTGNLRIQYYLDDPTDPLGFGFTVNTQFNKSFSYSFNTNANRGVTISPERPCDIPYSGPNTNAGEDRCFVIL